MTDQSNRNDHTVTKDSDKPVQRRAKLLSIILAQGRASVEDLSEILAASRETIRRDLAQMDANGQIRKVHGGAEIRRTDMVAEGPFRERMLDHVQAKRIIAQRAANLFLPGQSLFIDSGSTTIFLAEALAQKSGLVIITNSTTIASLCARDGRHEVHLLGGIYDEASAANLGARTINEARLYQTDHAVLTVGGVDETGLSDFNVDEAELARTMLAQANSTIVLADHSKMGKRGLYKIAGFDAVSTFVTEKAPTPVLADAMAGHPVRIVLA